MDKLGGRRWAAQAQLRASCTISSTLYFPEGKAAIDSSTAMKLAFSLLLGRTLSSLVKD